MLRRFFSPDASSLTTLSKLAHVATPLVHAATRPLLNVTHVLAPCPYFMHKRSSSHLVSSTVLRPPRLDYEWMTSHVEDIKRNIADRKTSGDPDRVKLLYEEYRRVRKNVEDLRRERNIWANKIPKLKDKSMKEEAVNKAKSLKARTQELEVELRGVKSTLDHAALDLPNTTHHKTPIGPESAAIKISTFGNPRDFSKEYSESTYEDTDRDENEGLVAENGNKLEWAPLNHLKLCELHDLVDFEAGSLVAGSKFSVLRGDAALLELALVSWSMNHLTSRGFLPTLVPDLCRVEMLEACGFNPRGSGSQTYFISEQERDEDTSNVSNEGGEENLALVGTAEIPLAGMSAGRIFNESELPHRVAGFSHSFRRETGSGAHSKGLYRLHQFSKVEMFVHCTPSQAESQLEELVEIQCDLLSQLGLHGQVLEMPSEELGASAHRKIDVEVWMPGRGIYGEVCSASDCTDYQSRRLNTQYVPDVASTGKKKRQFVSTLNATAIAIPRVILAILETHQQRDGSIILPGPLAKMLGKEKIEPRQ